LSALLTVNPTATAVVARRSLHDYERAAGLAATNPVIGAQR
jgi:hypothetical protein